MTQAPTARRSDISVSAEIGKTSFKLTFKTDPSESRFRAIIDGLKDAGYTPRNGDTKGVTTIMPVNMPTGQTVNIDTTENVDTILDQAFGTITPRIKAA